MTSVFNLAGETVRTIALGTLNHRDEINPFDVGFGVYRHALDATGNVEVAREASRIAVGQVIYTGVADVQIPYQVEVDDGELEQDDLVLFMEEEGEGGHEHEHEQAER